jgi:hypothetical protein
MLDLIASVRLDLIQGAVQPQVSEHRPPTRDTVTPDHPATSLGLRCAVRET